MADAKSKMILRLLEEIDRRPDKRITLEEQRILDEVIKLDLSGNNLESVPESIGELRNLSSLNLSENNLGNVPESIGELRNLSSLDLSFNNLESVPESIEKLRNLRTLNLSNNKLESVPESIGKLKNLKILILSWNNLSSMPESIGHLTKLEFLNLINNRLTSLPGKIGNLKTLYELCLSDNALVTLPESIGDIVGLNAMYLSNNPLESIPDWIGHLTKLETLELTDMTLPQLPLSLLDLNLPFKENGRWSSFKGDGIEIKNLKLTDQPIDMFLNNDRELIKDWYRQHELGATVKVNEAKVIFLGDGDVGKTYSIRRLLRDGELESAANEEAYKTTMTHGIIIKDMEAKMADGTDLNLRVWDFGGQAIMHSMHRCFLTNDTCYVVVISTRNDRDQMGQARFWLRNIRAFAGDAPVILYVNRWSTMSDRLDVDRLIQEFPTNLRSRDQVLFINVKTDSKQEFSKLKETIVAVASTLGSCGREVPIKWNNIRKELHSMARTKEKKTYYIDQDQYENICIQHHLYDDVEENRREELHLDLLTWFNTLGVCFSYHLNEFRVPLQRYKVLNPEWLTNAIYLLIMNGGKFAINGVLPQASINAILKHPEDGESGDLPYMQGVKYGEEQSTYIREVMRKFKLSYETPEGEFIPALCSSERPMPLTPPDFDAKKHEQATYLLKYEYLPDTVIQRLIIAYKEYRSTSEYWNKGMVIHLHDFQLTVVVDMGDGDNNLRVTVYSTGKFSPSVFMPSIRQRIAEINASLNLRPEEYIVAAADGKETNFKVVRLLNLQEKNRKYVEDEDGENEFSIDTLLSQIFGSKTIQRAMEIAKDDREKKDKTSVLNQAIREEGAADFGLPYHPSTEEGLTYFIKKALMEVQGNHIYHGSIVKEDHMNTGVKSGLPIYDVHDQTRKGRSVSGLDSGEVDLEINYGGFPIAIFEGQILEAVDKKKISEHVDKAIMNYNPHGLPYIYHTVYYRVNKNPGVDEERFAEFWKRYKTYLNNLYQAPLPVAAKHGKDAIREVDEAEANIRHAVMRLMMEGKIITVHFYAIKMEVY